MWYRARCKKECIFRGVRRRPGSIYEGPHKPPEHFEILDTRKDDGTAVLNRRNVCPFCGAELPASNDTSANALREEIEALKRELAEAREQIGSGAGTEDDPGYRKSQLARMKWDDLFRIGTEELDLDFNALSEQQGKTITREQMIDLIQEREVELANLGKGNSEGVN